MLPISGRADGLREIAWTEKEHIHAVQRGDGLQIVQWFGVFDLEYHDSLFVGRAHIFIQRRAGVTAIGVAAVERVPTERMKARLLHDILRVLTFVERYAARTCLGCMAGNEDLTRLIVFLASDAPRYLTGADIALGGGYTAK